MFATTTTVTVVSVVISKVNSDAVKVTLQRNNEYVSCDEIVLWDDELADDALFDEWASFAHDNEEGYAYFVQA